MASEDSIAFSPLIGKKKAAALRGIVGLAIMAVAVSIYVCQIGANFNQQQRELTARQEVHHCSNASFIGTNAAPSTSAAASAEEKKVVIDPFTELEFQLTDSNSSEDLSSSFRCVKNLFTDAFQGAADWKVRTCIFKNLYFEPRTNRFHYFASTEESKQYSVEELQDITSCSRSYILKNDFSTHAIDRKFRIQLQIHTGNDPPPQHAVVSHPLNPPIVLFTPSYAFNFGHLIGDDGFSITHMLETVGMSDQPAVLPLFYQQDGGDPYYRCLPSFNANDRWTKCRKMMRKAYPTFLGVATLDDGDIFRTKDQDFWTKQAAATAANIQLFRMPTVIAGQGGKQLHNTRQEVVARLLYRYRARSLRNMGITEEDAAAIRAESVTVILPIGNSHGEEIETMTALVPALQEHFGNTTVQAADFAKLTLKEQALLLLRTKVLIVNTGGGSMISMFLPRGSTLLMFHHKSGARFDLAFHEIGGQYQVEWMAPTENDEDVQKAVDYVHYAMSKPMVRRDR